MLQSANLGREEVVSKDFPLRKGIKSFNVEHEQQRTTSPFSPMNQCTEVNGIKSSKPFSLRTMSALCAALIVSPLLLHVHGNSSAPPMDCLLH